MISCDGDYDEQRCWQTGTPEFKWVARRRPAEGASWPFCFQVDTRGTVFEAGGAYDAVKKRQK
jgi:hypothetical protein